MTKEEWAQYKHRGKHDKARVKVGTPFYTSAKPEFHGALVCEIGSREPKYRSLDNGTLVKLK